MRELRDYRTGEILHAPEVDNSDFLARFDDERAARAEKVRQDRIVNAYREGRLDQLADQQWRDKGHLTFFAGPPYRFRPYLGNRDRRAHQAYLRGVRDERKKLPWPEFAGPTPPEWTQAHQERPGREGSDQSGQ